MKGFALTFCRLYYGRDVVLREGCLKKPADTNTVGALDLRRLIPQAQDFPERGNIIFLLTYLSSFSIKYDDESDDK